MRAGERPAHFLSRLVDRLADGVVTVEGRHDLDLVAGLLGLPRLRPPRRSSGSLRPGRRLFPHSRSWRREPGDLVVFTGAMSPAREVWQDEARAAGLRVGDGVRGQTGAST
ncbi:hypothetical protein [Actinoplanes sp. RD1]|uniref:hypothetical protein n=1 Tax=Actinoplanes sp. RD1 TaxID=3064538 RepID=UPI0027406888|nr:hypothetical protein [Actinoplanes sp. RD1]